MRLAFMLTAMLLLPQPTHWEEGIPQNLGTGIYPEGLLNNTDIDKLSKLRIESLKKKVDALQRLYEIGSISIDLLISAQQDLLMAKLELSSDKKRRLNFIEEALGNAIKLWQRAKAASDAGVRGGEVSNLFSAEEQVFRFRIMWLKENAAN